MVVYAVEFFGLVAFHSIQLWKGNCVISSHEVESAGAALRSCDFGERFVERVAKLCDAGRRGFRRKHIVVFAVELVRLVLVAIVVVGWNNMVTMLFLVGV